MPTCAQFAEAARALAGSRFHHHGRVPGHTDCAGLLFVAAWQIALQVADYTDYEPTPRENVLLSVVRDRCEPRDWSEWREPGRIIVLRQRPAGEARHFAVSLGGGEAIHQESRARIVRIDERPELIHSVWIFRGLEPWQPSSS